MSYFNARGSTVFVAALDISKAFDSVAHDKLFRTLSSKGIPNAIIDNLRNWYRQLLVNVQWGNSYSKTILWLIMVSDKALSCLFLCSICLLV